MYDIDRSVKSFRRSVRKVAKRGYDISKLENTIELLAEGKPMPPEYQDHSLKGKYIRYRECHVGGEGDWLLIYRKDHSRLILVLTETGTHSDLFE
ncbi:MAG: type II toxin-antitoxin system YafQ family toxin [Oscillospiraceae bacterium]|nr:type II toxin-antitoxin system YafQ family toxin [Oscillospiraceae bacterium]